MEQGKFAGMQTFDQSLYMLFKAGKISVDEALQHADSRNNLRLRLRLEDPSQFQSSEKLEIGADADKPLRPRRP